MVGALAFGVVRCERRQGGQEQGKDQSGRRFHCAILAVAYCCLSYAQVNECKLNTAYVKYPYNSLLRIVMRIIIISVILSRVSENSVFISAYGN